MEVACGQVGLGAQGLNPVVFPLSSQVMRINEFMLDETRDTSTVPPLFMLRTLASFNYLRAGRLYTKIPFM